MSAKPKARSAVPGSFARRQYAARARSQFGRQPQDHLSILNSCRPIASAIVNRARALSISLHVFLTSPAFRKKIKLQIARRVLLMGAHSAMIK